ncbi:MAG: HAMP domain-containing histidine kinase [Helicobacteraceae bacterium]|jgi:two-component system OmpR family sensor kinase|nr:HAMP domain-containing histidine kinase [Helicobacteraceae bacterium]
MIAAEKQALHRFLILYAGSLAFFLGIIGWGYYGFHSRQIAKAQQNELRIMTTSIGRSLKRGEQPDEDIAWAIVDSYGRTYAGTFKLATIDARFVQTHHDGETFFSDERYIYRINALPTLFEPRFLIVRAKVDSDMYRNLIVNMIAIWGGAFIFFMAIAAILTRMFLKPMRDTISLLDRFIKDSTHEMTTPIAAILMSVESFGRENLSERDQKRLARIEIAARTIKNVYDDLAFVLLDARRQKVLSAIDVGALIKERIEFFEPIGRARNVVWEVFIGEHTQPIADKSEFTRIADNLLSNAIKYNKQGGRVIVRVEGCSLSIEDEGGGVGENDRVKILDRFARLDSAQGGFGLGLNIVKTICDRAKMTIEVKSAEGGGGKFVISWRTSQEAHVLSAQ